MKVDAEPQRFISNPFAYHSEVEMTISGITNLGLGVGRVNNWVVMVPYVCVGEVVVARIYKNLKNYSLGDLVRIVKSSESRVEERCPLFGTCGGCQYQHMSYEEQLKIKRQHVVDSMERLAGIDFPVNECLRGDEQYNYRAKITPHFQKIIPPIGFLKTGKREIVDVEKCFLATENINNALGAVRGEVFARKKSLKKGGTILLRDVDGRIVTNPGTIVSQKIGNFEFFFRAGEFFQNNPHMLEKLVNFVTTCAVGTKYLLDAYCGVGIFGIVAARNFDGVIGVEISASAVEFAKKNASKNSVTNINFVAGDADHMFDGTVLNGDFSEVKGENKVMLCGQETTVIVDPPRTGCSSQFLLQLMAFGPEKIVYVSCAPDTQARDLKIICQKYAATKIQPLDMFPQTRHIENVVVLVKIKT
jgi:23S rRNA (uracil1939-C5)-methyltransferase/tRNA (uracil-5-)-methyltransferase